MDRNEIISRLREHREALNRDYGVASIGLFGSAARNELRPDSDVDLLVEFAPDRRIGLSAFVQLQRRLEALLGRQADLSTPGSLKKQLKDQILQELVRAA